MVTGTDLTTNRILRALPRASLDGLRPHLRTRRFEPDTTIHASDGDIAECVFPLTGLASMLVTEASGDAVDTALIGPEGFVGLPVFLGTDRMPVEAMCQLEMEAAVIGSRDLRRCLAEDPQLAAVLHRYTQMVLVELARLVLCNRLHSLEHRTARWLLQVHDRVRTDVPLQLTHEFLSRMLGSHRPSVTLALGALESGGLIETTRGTVTVLDTDGLEAAACDCYRTIRDELDRLLSAPQAAGRS